MKICAIYSYEESFTKDINGQEVVENRPCAADRAIAAALRSLGHIVVLEHFDKNNLPSIKKEYDLVFNLCDGFNDDNLNEEMVLTAFEEAGITFTGCGTSAVRLCTNKAAAKDAFVKKGVRVAPFQLMTTGEEQLFDGLQFPLIVKPNSEDASEGIDDDSVVFDEKALRKKVLHVINDMKRAALVEEYIDGRELCIPILGDTDPFVLPPLEIDYSEHFDGKPKILSFKAKWSKNSTAFKNTYSVIAQNLDDDLRRKAIKAAKQAFIAAGCTGYGTVDMRIDAAGQPYVLEINPNAYIAPESDLAKASASIGLDYAHFLERIAVQALKAKPRSLQLPEREAKITSFAGKRV